MADLSRQAKKQAIGKLLKLVSDAHGARLKAKRAPPPAPAKAEKPAADDINDDDARKLIEFYEAKQNDSPEA